MDECKLFCFQFCHFLLDLWETKKITVKNSEASFKKKKKTQRHEDDKELSLSIFNYRFVIKYTFDHVKT